MLISVALPVFNGANYVVAALESILAQDCDLEVVVSDDASSDRTVDLIKSIHDPRIELISNNQNAGIFGNLNRCLDRARGSVIQLFSQDDLMCPGFLASQAAKLRTYPGAGLVYGTPIYIDQNGSIIPSSGQDDTPELVDQHMYVWIASHYGALPASISSVMFPRSTIETVGRFDPTLRVAGDIEFYHRVAERRDIIRNTDVLHKVRSHRSATSSLSSAGPLYLREEAILDRWYRDRWSDLEFEKVRRFRSAARGNYHLGWIARAVLRGEYIKAAKALPLLHSLYPLQWVFWWQWNKRILRKTPKPFLAPPR